MDATRSFSANPGWPAFWRLALGRFGRRLWWPLGAAALVRRRAGSGRLGRVSPCCSASPSWRCFSSSPVWPRPRARTGRRATYRRSSRQGQCRLGHHRRRRRGDRLQSRLSPHGRRERQTKRRRRRNWRWRVNPPRAVLYRLSRDASEGRTREESFPGDAGAGNHRRRCVRPGQMARPPGGSCRAWQPARRHAGCRRAARCRAPRRGCRKPLPPRLPVSSPHLAPADDLFRDAPMGVAFADAGGVIIEANRGLCAILRRRRPERPRAVRTGGSR